MKERFAKLKGGLFRHWKDVKDNWRNTDDPMKLGLAWSKGFVALLFILALIPYSSGGAGWEFKFWTLLKSPPNEIGDTLAGIAGALAFLWIIVTVQLQSKELRAQRQELEFARNEYAKMADAQEKQVELMDAQSKVIEEEQRQRKVELRDREIEQQVYALCLTLVYIEESVNETKSWGTRSREKIREVRTDDTDVVLTKIINRFYDLRSELKRDGEKWVPSERNKRLIDEAWLKTQSLLAEEQCSEGQKLWLQNAGLVELGAELEKYERYCRVEVFQ